MNHNASATTAGNQSMAQNVLQRSGRQTALTMTGVMLAMVLAAVNQSIVATAMPGIIADLGGFDRYTWPATAHLVASTVAIPIVGRLSDLYGRKLFFILGIIVLILGSILGGLSQSMTQLVAYRAIQGIGCGIIMTCCFMAIADLFPPDERANHQGLLGAVYGMASVAGPVLGGFITDEYSWPWIFFINAPAGIAIWLLIARTFPRIKSEVEIRSLDYRGMATLVLAVVPILLALAWSSVQYGWSTPQTIGLLVFGLAMTTVFTMIEAKSNSPIMPLDIYGERVVSIAAFVTFMTGFVLNGSVLFIPLFLQGVVGVSASGSGGILASMIAGIICGAILCGQVIARFGNHYRLLASISAGVMMLGMYLIGMMDESTDYTLAMGYIALMGFGQGGTMSTLNIAVQNTVPFSRVGVATSALQFFRQIGGTLGLAVMGAVLTNRFSSIVEEAVPDAVKAVLAPGRLDAIKENPRILVDPSATDALRTEFAASGPGGAQLADMFLAALNSSLSWALEDVFVVGTVVAGLAAAAALFLRSPSVASPDPKRPASGSL